MENAIQADPRVSEVAAVGVPDEHLGELVAAVVSTKLAYKGQVQEHEVIEIARKEWVTLHRKISTPELNLRQDYPDSPSQ